MSEIHLAPLLLIHVPAGHEVDPQALEELKAHASEQYGASVLINPRQTPQEGSRPVILGHWGRTLPAQVMADLEPRIERVFFNLDWLADVI